MHNLYPLLYNKAVFEVTKEATGRGLVWGRAGWAGSQRYPVQWSGDPQSEFGAMACTLRGGLSYGLSGVPFWSHDIGGFYGDPPNSRLYIRWSQFGLLSSHARCHGKGPREPWEYGPEALRIFRTFAKLRYRLIPYLYSYAYEAQRTGLPVMRAMVLEYQDDPNTYHLDLQYMLGRELLVAPLFDESDEKVVYLPKGKWIDYWSGEEYRGPENINYRAPLDIIPLFVKSGAIIPLAPEMNYVGEKPFDPITLDIYPEGISEFILYDDDEIITFRCEKRAGEIILSSGESNKRYIAKFKRIKEPWRIEADGKELHFYPQEQWKRVDQGWFYDAANQIVWVKFFAPKGIVLRVIIGSEGKL